MTSYARPPMPTGVKTLPARYYTDPAHFALELDRIHLDWCLGAGRPDALAAPGGYFLRQVGNASVIVLRGEDGQVRAFHNVCRHRGTLLCAQPEGALPGRIQCSYHAWTYRLDGTLLAAPHMDQVEGFREADYPLRPVAVDLWDGHVFINLSERPAPLADQPAAARRRLYSSATLPTLPLNPPPASILPSTLCPLAPAPPDVVCECHFHPEAMARPDFDPKGAIDFWDVTNRQDWELSELAQKGIGSRGYQPGPYSNREELLHALDRFVLGRVGIP